MDFINHCIRKLVFIPGLMESVSSRFDRETAFPVHWNFPAYELCSRWRIGGKNSSCEDI
jgi:hypothetical protein